MGLRNPGLSIRKKILHPKILAEIEKVKPKANPIADGAKPAQET